MVETDNSKRNFFKKIAAVVGFFSATGIFSKLVSQRTNSTNETNDKYAKDIRTQKKAWMQKRFTLMTDNEKKQMLDEFLENHNNANS